ncbi:MAG: signal peptidase I [Acidobacteria bacterium]|nr:MAG: signal peptidase I [Acidobacteriota bacterium]
MTTPTRFPPNEPKTETSELEVPNTEMPRTALGDEAQGEAVVPSQSAAVVEPDPALSLESKSVESPRDMPPEAGEDVPPKPGTFRSIVELVHDLAIAVVICVLLITYVVQAFKVQGTSMSPELKDGERILVNKFMYHFSDIARGDVVVFWYPEDPELSFIKRIIALPGETVEIKSGDVFVDGVLIHESYVTSAHADRRSHPSQEIRPGHYFVLGDNRRGSNDSRSWGLVPERYIYGRAFVRIWPPSDVGLVQ